MKAVISWRQISAGHDSAWHRKTVEGAGPFFIGRSRDNFIHLDDLRVSRKHLSFQPRGEQVLVTDYGSANGAFMDGAPFKSAIWTPGHRIQIADYEFHLSWEEALDRRAAAEALRGGPGDQQGQRAPPTGEPRPHPARPSAGAGAEAAGRGGSFGPDSHPAPIVGRAGAQQAHFDPQAVAVAVAAQRAREQEAAALGMAGGAGFGTDFAAGGVRSSGARRLTQPSRRALRASGLLVPSAIAAQVMALFAIVVSSVLMTVHVIILSVSAKTEIVQNKAKEVLSIFGIEIARDEEGGSGFAGAVDPWAFAGDIEAYRWLVVAAIAIYVLALGAFWLWHVAVDRSVPFGLGQSFVGRVLSGPAAWFVPGVNLVQPPRILDRLYGIVLGGTPVGMGPAQARALVWAWWVLLLSGAAAMIAGALFPPERLDAYGAATMIAGPLFLIAGAALAVVLVRDMTGRVVGALAGG